MAEFNANAISLVGNFSGPCLIYLNGESITVKRADNYEIAKWPYIVIRQFRAEEEQGRFSFVSGRRGPYGVAEYNFLLQKSMLNELQEALTQFTGAQFSNVAPGSGLDPPPVPTSHRPSHTNPLHPSPSITSINSVGSTTSYDPQRGRASIDGSYSSPSHVRGGPPPVLTGPRLPPRDYLPSPLQQGMSPPADGRYVRGPGQRPSHSASELADFSKQHSASPPTPSHSHNPHTSTPSLQREGWVLKSSTYETRRPIPRPKPEAINGMRGQSPTNREEMNVPIDPPQLPPKYIPAAVAPPTSDTPATEGEVPKKSAYDHLTLSQEQEAEQVSQKPPSQTDTSEDPDSSNLDFHPRRSPQLGARSITPEEARLLHHVNSVEDNGDIIINTSPTIRGRRSPEDRLKRSQTERVVSPLLTAPETYDVPPNRLVKQHSADEIGSDSHYHIPKPTSNAEYHVPRPYDDSRNRGDYYHQPKAAEETYKIPKPYEKNAPITYDSPKHTQEQFYSTPKSLAENVAETNNFYTNISTGNEPPTQEQFYSVPRTPTAAKSHAVSGDLSHQSPGNLYSSPRRGNSEKITGSDSIDGGSPPRLHKLRSARSAESLATRRINHNHSGGHISPPDPSSEHNMYVDIDRKQPAPTADNLYAEIPADYVPRRIQLQSSSGSLVPQPSASSQNHYDQVPSRNASQLQKQRALANEGGYELFLPAEVNPDSFNTMTLPTRGKRASASPPKLIRDRGTSLEKYDIRMPTVRPNRPRSEADLLDSTDSHKLTPAHGVDVLGSSIPTESSFPVTDEYVIITHKDTRPKFPPTQPQGIPGVSAETPSSNQITAGDQSDEYQLMSAVKINRAELKESSLYDTPNPSLSSNSHQSSGASQPAEPHQDNQYEVVNTLNYQRLASESSLDMEGVSPRSSRQLEEVRNMSFDSVFSSDREVEGQLEQDGSMVIPQKARMRIASGSPRDSTSSLDLKNRSRSHGNVLDKDPTKKHNYINVSDNDPPSQSIEEKIRTSSLATAAMTKPPMPLPKPPALAGKPGDSPKQSRHGYERVDISKVKGNAHPLSCDAVTPQ